MMMVPLEIIVKYKRVFLDFAGRSFFPGGYYLLSNALRCRTQYFFDKGAEESPKPAPLHLAAASVYAAANGREMLCLTCDSSKPFCFAKRQWQERIAEIGFLHIPAPPSCAARARQRNGHLSLAILGAVSLRETAMRICGAGTA